MQKETNSDSDSDSDSSLFNVRETYPRPKPTGCRLSIPWAGTCGCTSSPGKKKQTDRQYLFPPQEVVKPIRAYGSTQPSRQAISRCSQHEDSMLKSSADDLAYEHYKTKLFSIRNSVSAIQSTFHCRNAYLTCMFCFYVFLYPIFASVILISSPGAPDVHCM
jgi:hypothetical protein